MAYRLRENEEDAQSRLALDFDIILTPKTSVEDAVKALENMDNYGSYVSNMRNKASVEKAKTETEKAKNLSKAFKRMAVKNGIPIIDVAAVTMSEGHSERPPELEEVAWSKQLAYDADLVLAIHREYNSDVFQVVSRKVRRSTQFGFYLRWNLETGKWNEEWDL